MELIRPQHIPQIRMFMHAWADVQQNFPSGTLQPIGKLKPGILDSPYSDLELQQNSII